MGDIIPRTRAQNEVVPRKIKHNEATAAEAYWPQGYLIRRLNGEKNAGMAADRVVKVLVSMIDYLQLSAPFEGDKCTFAAACRFNQYRKLIVYRDHV